MGGGNSPGGIFRTPNYHRKYFQFYLKNLTLRELSRPLSKFSELLNKDNCFNTSQKFTSFGNRNV